MFIADVNQRRFPSGLARQKIQLPFDVVILKTIDTTHLSDNNNYDHERRLMYVALTRAERYLFVTRSGGGRSHFFEEVANCVKSSGGTVASAPAAGVPTNLQYLNQEFRRDFRLTTSFSDLRYYLEVSS